MQRLEDTSTSFAVALAIIGYSLCSSTMLLANKMAMEYLPSPSTVSLIQIAFAAIAVVLIKYAGYEVDWFEWDKMKAYAWYVVIFVAAIYSNMQALKNANVETVIVFRACTPIAVCALEYLLLDRSYPSMRSALSMLAVVLGAVWYCLSDSQFSLQGVSAYYWVFAYFVLISVEMTYGKKLTSSVQMQSVWGPVLYCNIFSILPMFMISYGSGELNETIWEEMLNVPFHGWMVILFSCIVGTLIGYTGWLCRSMVSATTFTLVGVVNKFLTVLLNVVVWDKHSSPVGVVAVCTCLLAGAFYQQAPRRDEAHHASTATASTTSSSISGESRDATRSPVRGPAISATHGKRDCDTPVRAPDVTPTMTLRSADRKIKDRSSHASNNREIELTDRQAADFVDTDPLLSEN